LNPPPTIRASAPAGDFTTPVRVLHGTADGCTSPAKSREWFEHVATRPDRKKYVSVPGARHIMYRGRHAAGVTAEVAAFLQGVARGE